MTMRERMARAMFDVGAKRMHSAKTWETCEQGYRDLMLAEVDAALEAQLKPTAGMVDAGMAIGGLCDIEIQTTWTAMVQAIKEGK